ncbi:MAG: hypothetical protein ACERKZ_21560, partial [Lachnotalea sp.]
MNKKDFPDLEDKIKDTVKNALDGIDFITLKRNISGKTESTIDYAKMNLKNKSQQYNEKMENETKDKYKNSMYISKMPKGRISGIIYTIFGIMGIGTISILLIVFFFIGLLSNFKLFAILLAFLGLNTTLVLKGKNSRKRVKRFNQYVRLFAGKNYYQIKQLATATGKSEKFIVKDLRKMIDLDMFKEAFINEEKTYFMLGNEIYLLSQENSKKRNEQELKKEKAKENENNPENKELTHTIEMVKDYIKQIKNANNAISNEEISMKLQRLQNIVSEIINFVEKNPKKLPEVRKFTTHYLPI